MLAGEDEDAVELPQEAAASVYLILASITALLEFREQFIEAEAFIDLCVETVEEGALPDPSVQMATSALANLCAEACDVSDAVVLAGGAAALVSLLRRWAGAPRASRKGSVRTVQWAAAALCNLSQAGGEAVSALVSCDVVGAIDAALSHRNDSSTEQFLCGCLCNVAALDPRALLDSGGIKTVLEMMQHGNSSRGKRAAVQVISNLQHVRDFDVNQELRDAGVVESLREVARGKSPKKLRESIEGALGTLALNGDENRDDLPLLETRSRKRSDTRRKRSQARTPSGKDGSRTSADHGRSSAQRQLDVPNHADVYERDEEPSNARQSAPQLSGSQLAVSNRSNSSSAGIGWQDPMSFNGAVEPSGFSPAKAAALLRSKKWSARSIEALLQRPEKLRAVMATVCSRPDSASPQRFIDTPTQPVAYADHSGAASSKASQRRHADYSGSTQLAADAMLVRQSEGYSHLYTPGRLPARPSTAIAQFGRSTNVAALPVWGIDVLNMFLPAGLSPRRVVYRCFGEAFARAEDLLDVLLLERYPVAVLTFRYIDEESCTRAYARLQDDPRLQHTANGWPLRLVQEEALIKTYVKSAVSTAGGSEVSVVQEIFGSCPGSPKYEDCEAREGLPPDSNPEVKEVHVSNGNSDDDFRLGHFEAGHLRCFYRNQTDLSEFAYACASAGFSTRQLGVVDRQSEWDGQTRPPSRREMHSQVSLHQTR